jgi:beta-galactosidase
MRIGAAYYPEHWPRQRWPVDARMMKTAGLNLVRMAEFAWTRLEPSAGRFDFGWLDEAIALLGRHGIGTILGTPTAAPPGWVVAQSPEILPVTADGHVIGFGARRHYCPTRAGYRVHVERIVRAMGRHFAGNRHVICWQIDNELGNYCWCDSCQAAFQSWLKHRYRTLDALNAAWGTDFWSEVFTAWEQIPAPRQAGAAHHPSLLLAWKRFYSEAWDGYYRFQRDLLKAGGVKAPITTNMMGTFPHLDYYQHARGQDLVIWDNYTEPGYPWRYRSAISCDFMRSVRGNRPYWTAEQQSGCSGHDKVYGRTEPGRIRLMTYQAIAHGGAGICYFRWRTCRFGVEQYWHGILQHDGRPNWRYREVARIAQEFRALPADLFAATTPARSALMFSYPQLWAHEAQPHVEGFSYELARLNPYQALRDAGIDTGIINEDSDLSPYRLVVLPAWLLVSAKGAAWIKAFVRQGGTAVITYRSGVRDDENVVVAEPCPGLLRRLLGITVDDYDALGNFNESVGVEIAGDLPFAGTRTGTLWADVITADTARVVGAFTGHWYAGRPAITVNRYGKGEAWYVGCEMGMDFWQPFIGHLAARLGLPTAPPTSERVEVARRRGRRLYTFVMNMNPAEGWIDLPRPQWELLSDERLGPGRVRLPKFAVRILVDPT